MTKDTINNMKNQPLEWEKILCANYLSGKGLISKILGWSKYNHGFGLCILQHYNQVKYIFINQNGNNYNQHNFANEKYICISL